MVAGSDLESVFFCGDGQRFGERDFFVVPGSDLESVIFCGAG